MIALSENDLLRSFQLTLVVAAMLVTTTAARANQADFFARHDFAVGQSVANEGFTAVAVSDLNQDGIPDLVVVNSGQGEVLVELANGPGSFGAAAVYNAGFQPEGIVVADFNHDGIADIAVSNFFGTINVLVGKGGGVFAPAVQYGVGNGDGSDNIAIGDFNGDGLPDLVISSGLNTCLVFEGKGDGTFHPPLTANCGGAGSVVRVADFNRDGKADLVVSGGEFGVVAVMLGNGNGTFQKPKLYFTPANMDIAVGDFNGDGLPDVAVALPGSATASVGILLGNGNGTLQNVVTYADGATGAQSIAVADFNGDGVPDLAVANRATILPSISVLIGIEGGGFAAPQQFAMTDPFYVTVAGFEKKGEPDIVVINDLSSSVSVLFHRNSSKWEAAPSYATGPKPLSLAVGDWNGDGLADVAVALAQGQIDVYLQNTSGKYQFKGAAAAGTLPEAMLTADVNGDGIADLATANRGLDNVSILLGNGDGTFQPATNFEAGTDPVSLAAADVNADGHLDLLVLNEASSQVSVLLGKGDGTFASPPNYRVANNPTGIAVGDLNGDGNPDIAVAIFGANDAPGQVAVLLGKRDGTFGPQTLFPTGGVNAHSLVIADFNNDGNNDVMVTNFDDGSVSLLLGDGDGRLQEAGRLEIGPIAEPTNIVSGDFNQDGTPDAAVVLFGAGMVAIIQVDGGQLQAPLLFGASNVPINLATENVNGDGKPDLVVANSTAKSFSVLQNVSK
jgi:hypothetical protein